MMKNNRFRLLLVFLTTFALFAGSTVAPVAASYGRSDYYKTRSDRRAIPKVRGSVYTLSDQGFDETVEAILGAIAVNPNLGIPLIVDHADAAERAGLELDPNTVIFFGNPNLGTPLMQADQLAGIDLPQKIHVFEENDRVFVGYNSTRLLKARHDLGRQVDLATIEAALENLTAVGTGNEDALSRTRSPWRFFWNDGLTTVTSDAGIDETWDRLLAAIDASPANVELALDHQANAARVGLDLGPTRLVVFGNPNIGTPLMVADPSAGIDLPLKILVWEDENEEVFVTTNDTRYLNRRHGLRRVDLSTIDGALDNFLRAASVTAS